MVVLAWLITIPVRLPLHVFVRVFTAVDYVKILPILKLNSQVAVHQDVLTVALV